MIKDFGGPQLHTQPHIFQQKATFNKPIAGLGGLSSPIWSQAPQQRLHDPGYAYYFFDDFLTFTTVHEGWISTADSTGTAAISTGAGGQLVLLSAATDNDSITVMSSALVYTLAAGKTLFWETRLKLTDTSTNIMNAYAGLTAGTVGTNVPLTTNGGGPSADDAMGFFKTEGSSVWQAENTNTTAETTASAGTCTSGVWYRLGMIATTTQIEYFIDDRKVATHSTVAYIPNGAMKLAFTVKSSTGAETMTIDWVKVCQIR